MISWLRITSIGFFVALMLPFSASAAVIYEQLDASIPITGAVNASITSPTTFVLTSTSTVGSTSFYCGLTPFIGANHFCNVVLLDENGVTYNLAQQEINTATTDLYTLAPLSSLDLGPHTYTVRMTMNVSGDQVTSKGNLGGDTYIIISDTAAPDFTTRIDTVTPAATSTIATSTSFVFGATGYINSNDFVEGMVVRVQYLEQSSNQASIANPYNLGTTLDFNVSTSGLFTFSTTTSVTRTGNYTMYTTIQTPSLFSTVLNFLGFGQFATQGIKTATTTGFTVVAPTAYDILIASTTASINAYLASSTVSLAACTNWTQLNLIDCLNLLFVPDIGQLTDAMGKFRDGFLSLKPWGYVTRMVVILSSNATTSVPVITTFVPDPSTGGTLDWTYDPNEAINGAADLLDGVHSAFGAPVTIKDAMEPIVQAVIALSVIMYIFYDMIRSRKRGSHGGGGGKLS